MKAKHYFSWIIAYIDADAVEKVSTELKKHRQYEEVEAFIPMVKLLKKTLKGKDSFEYVPLLFNYGFFKVPRKFAIYPKYLDEMKENISCIIAWVKDPAKMKKTLGGLKLGERKFIDEGEIGVATASSKDIAKLVKDAVKHSIHSGEDLETIGPGSIITLHGYPFENVEAIVVEIDPAKKRVKVKLMLFNAVRDVSVDVSFDNVFYTIYHGRRYDDNIGIKGSLNTDLDDTLNQQTFKKFVDGKDK